MSEILKECLKVTDLGDSAAIGLPFRFPRTSARLTVTAAEKDGSVYLSDGGAAFRELSSATDDPYVRGEVFRYITAVYLNAEPGENGAVEWAISQGDVRRFFRFIQCVSLCANADLYPRVNGEKLENCSKYVSRYPLPAGTAFPKGFVGDLSSSVRSEDGLILSAFAFTDESAPMSIAVSRSGDVTTFTDRGNFDGGDLIERIRWYNNDGHRRFDGFIAKVCERFGADYDGRKVRYSFRPSGDSSNEESVAEAVFTFMQLAAILAETGVTVVADQ